MPPSKWLKCTGLLLGIVFAYWCVFLYADMMSDMHDCFADIDIDALLTAQMQTLVPPSVSVECEPLNENGVGTVATIIHMVAVVFAILGSTWSGAWYGLKTMYE